MTTAGQPVLDVMLYWLHTSSSSMTSPRLSRPNSSRCKACSVAPTPNRTLMGPPTQAAGDDPAQAGRYPGRDRSP